MWVNALLTLFLHCASAPATRQVRQLRDELFALRRDKAVAEQKEAEVRCGLVYMVLCTGFHVSVQPPV